MKKDDRTAFIKGFKDAFPVFMGYFAVSITLGITASNAGLNWFEASIMSLLNVTSAGEAAAIQIIHDHGTVTEIIFSQLAINIRYLLMGTALAVRLKPNTGNGVRMLTSLGITDELFGLSISQEGEFNGYYTFGGYCFAMPGWVIGTCLGVLMGRLFPTNIIAALSLGIYVMFIAIIVKPAMTSLIYSGIIVVSGLLSFLLFRFVPSISFGMRVVILTVLIASVAAWLFPIEEDEKNE